MHVSRPTVFHIICSQDAIPTIEEKLALFSRPAYPVRATFYPLTQDDISRRAARAGVGTSHEAGMGGLVKTFIHEVLHDVERIIFVDTDMLFLVDPALLWREFDAMDENQMVAFPTLGPKSHSGWICTCVMILNLKAMRERMFMPSNLLPTTPSLGSPDVWKDTGTDPYNPDYGDQGLYWAIWQGYPQHFKHLSISWDTTHCRYSYGMSLADGDENMSEEEQVARQWDTQQAPERFKQLFPAILHFNCQNMDVVWDDDINQRRTRWGPFVTIAIQYKWIWLNRGDGSATVQVNTVEHPVFWDELVASASTGDVDESTKQPVHGHGHGWGGHRS
ncbi:hypothetical protein PUNSTDRAFT_59955 [Punctularia strigosozonata HHB-11173 SS5]|uniref:uncharacterized protein n=1 Tax=Punctularia strigosozonata (strain HHB-11173) TaxID=741275 RepID=UPI0004416BE0|nr:uncharacterized protein PUNSTDRAFT_59955 [Punctularia strigosozonata HHB-11173 SS5]EIN12624.1 hypothetical protein PUNSTDRAFT_59955 [Punctularia strigosozonata HHB-11173 SS5]